MYPSCIYEEYGVSKTFLILYRNEEIMLDDQIIFKVSTLVNAFNVRIELPAVVRGLQASYDFISGFLFDSWSRASKSWTCS